jgi:hypothetical protein
MMTVYGLVGAIVMTMVRAWMRGAALHGQAEGLANQLLQR